MITSVFSKSKPINFILLALVLVLCFFLFQLKNLNWINSISGVLEKIIVLVFLIASTFITNFITKKNGLSRDNCFSFLIFQVLLLLFPSIFVNTNIVISNFFILLALRRLISLQSLLTPKEKIFDASLWVFIAALFYFWSILFILLVFISIIFHVSRDYRNWIIPFIALFTVGIIYVFAALVIDKSIIFNVLDQAVISFDFNYFKNGFQNIALVFFTITALFFLINQLFSFSKKPVNLHSAYKKIIFAFFIGVLIYLISTNKNNSCLIYTFAPLAIMGANYIENLEKIWTKDLVLYMLIGVSIIVFFSQLSYNLLP